jgi:hypothetical protein
MVNTDEQSAGGDSVSARLEMSLHFSGLGAFISPGLEELGNPSGVPHEHCDSSCI